MTVCATTYCFTRGNHSGCFPFAFSRHLAPFGAPSQRPRCRRNDRMRLCPCKTDRVFQVSSGSDFGHTCSAAVTDIEFEATGYRTGHCILPRRYHSVNHSPIETPHQQQTIRSARPEMIWILCSSSARDWDPTVLHHLMRQLVLRSSDILTGILFLSIPSYVF